MFIYFKLIIIYKQRNIYFFLKAYGEAGMMEQYTVSFFGHRIISDFHQAEKKVEILVCNLLQQKKYVEFLVGGDGDFDQIVSSAVKRLQHRIRNDNSALVWVLPYPTTELRNNEKNFSAY